MEEESLFLEKSINNEVFTFLTSCCISNEECIENVVKKEQAIKSTEYLIKATSEPSLLIEDITKHKSNSISINVENQIVTSAILRFDSTIFPVIITNTGQLVVFNPLLEVLRLDIPSRSTVTCIYALTKYTSLIGWCGVLALGFYDGSILLYKVLYETNNSLNIVQDKFLSLTKGNEVRFPSITSLGLMMKSSTTSNNITTDAVNGQSLFQESPEAEVRCCHKLFSINLFVLRSIGTLEVFDISIEVLANNNVRMQIVLNCRETEKYSIIDGSPTMMKMIRMNYIDHVIVCGEKKIVILFSKDNFKTAKKIINFGISELIVSKIMISCICATKYGEEDNQDLMLFYGDNYGNLYRTKILRELFLKEEMVQILPFKEKSRIERALPTCVISCFFIKSTRKIRFFDRMGNCAEF
ncbi:hypothetical protein ABK040_000141 [Willaertia magna]